MFKYFFIILSLVFLSGCTKTIDANYQSGINISNNVLENKKIAVHEFEDLRAWIDTSDKKSPSFIAQQGVWRFGLSYQGTDYQKISYILQDIFINELQSVSADAFSFDKNLPFDYELKGKIINFEFENETGFVTVTSKRHVSLQLTLNDNLGQPVVYNEIFNEVDRENEGMGILHSTNVKKLLQNQLKKTITHAIEKFNIEVAKQGVSQVIVSLNGKTINTINNGFIYESYAMTMK
ncbi:hypothetical protein [uncultured Shewanella sp.]|uniref:hypothetical protein n=1 Tax=uncultured Shewanella sp. TaxID=173975 RepID=UPI0026354BF2|nr:hypothetical protein [uncultured Shewanella sp.]